MNKMSNCVKQENIAQMPHFIMINIVIFVVQQQDTTTAKHHKAFASLDFDIDLGGPFSFSDHDSGQVQLDHPTL